MLRRGPVLHWAQDVGVQCFICMMSGSSSSLSAGCQGSSFSLNAGCMSPWFYVSCHSSLRKADRILGSSQTLLRPSTNQTLCRVIAFDAVWPPATAEFHKRYIHMSRAWSRTRKHNRDQRGFMFIGRACTSSFSPHHTHTHTECAIPSKKEVNESSGTSKSQQFMRMQQRTKRSLTHV